MASEAGFTKGPWEFSLSNHYGYSVLWNPETRQEVLTTSGFNDGDHPITWMGEEASAADLALITAAPDLYAAAKDFVEKVERCEAKSTRSYAAFKAALAKAEGK